MPKGVISSRGRKLAFPAALLFQRLANTIGDHGRVVIDRKCHGALEAVRSRDPREAVGLHDTDLPEGRLGPIERFGDIVKQ